MNKSMELNFLAHHVRQYRLMFTNTESLSKTKHNLKFRMNQILSSKPLFIYSQNADGQLRYGSMFSNRSTANFSQNAAVKKF